MNKPRLEDKDKVAKVYNSKGEVCETFSFRDHGNSYLSAAQNYLMQNYDKLMAEEVEQMDEAAVPGTKKHLENLVRDYNYATKRYHYARENDTGEEKKHLGNLRRAEAEIHKHYGQLRDGEGKTLRSAGISSYDTSNPKKFANSWLAEEVEQMDEVSGSRLGKYIVAAREKEKEEKKKGQEFVQQMKDAGMKGVGAPLRHKGPHKGKSSREAMIKLATNKLTNPDLPVSDRVKVPATESVEHITEMHKLKLHSTKKEKAKGHGTSLYKSPATVKSYDVHRNEPGHSLHGEKVGEIHHVENDDGPSFHGNLYGKNLPDYNAPGKLTAQKFLDHLERTGFAKKASEMAEEVEQMDEAERKSKEAPVTKQVDVSHPDVHKALEDHLGGRFEHFDGIGHHHEVIGRDGKRKSAINVRAVHSYTHKDLGMRPEDMDDTSESYVVKIVNQGGGKYTVIHHMKEEGAEEMGGSDITAATHTALHYLGEKELVDKLRANARKPLKEQLNRDMYPVEQMRHHNEQFKKHQVRANRLFSELMSASDYRKKSISEIRRMHEEMAHHALAASLHYRAYNLHLNKSKGEHPETKRISAEANRLSNSPLYTTRYKLEEKLTSGMSAGEIISDFVHSDDPKFDGKSKEERKRMALGAYYGMHPEKSKNESVENKYLSNIIAKLEEGRKPKPGSKAWDRQQERLKAGGAETETPHVVTQLMKHADYGDKSHTYKFSDGSTHEVTAKQRDKILAKLRSMTGPGKRPEDREKLYREVNTAKGFFHHTGDKPMEPEKRHPMSLQK